MRVMGIDCGSEYTGFGIVESDDRARLHCIVAGAVHLSARDPLENKLAKIFRELCSVIREHDPEVVAIEDVFYAVNAKSALKLGHVRGVAMLAVAECGLRVATYAPLAVKSAVVGYGKAEKCQVQAMVARLLNLPQVPEPADVADALAIAICHLHTSATLTRMHAKA
ncbi:crossover junction endodeoxyribonuclease RuvC [Candidatus Koribacter versatilis Ellin345]|uniref:Crossover junction endodeoxyribonuclease RuvC n=1 Tax=Koribacter versatilis (strain Ellin345) TaxID=204669 RepID=RUVC_KORVE|nr:crossover junction endodeoxyribonuclease RuvC [Candidatus Koribacter versatilis]Q1IKI1.1 RecName: Full=Crossover junction endodeoxyribonuclease RuvC; AltName: Full=Holliday junction nuclease RuvC; AltName: Full=Holliday junction resolvase RuvC [Candidatus Koribacter versatilis Ellin345]ABF42619.1 crossover junction endodeoxyribonuclease RuvC [Candidatus Koribacter versatilis Ellin345]